MKNVSVSGENSIGRNAVLGLQHLLAMYAGDILIPLLIGGALHFNAVQMTYLISTDIFMCGVATFLQIKRTPLTGIGLPVVLGCAVEYVAPLEAIGKNYGLAYMYGGIIMAGLLVMLLAGPFAKLRRFFPPVVTGSLITLIGLTLIPVAFQNMGGGDPTAKNFGDPTQLGLALFTAIVIIAINIWGRGFFKQIAILVGILAGMLLAMGLGTVNFHSVGTAQWLSLPHFFYFATPKFEWSSAISLALAAITCMIESTGVYFAMADIVGTKLTDDDLKRGYRSEGLSAILGGLFNTFPYSTFSQNVGIVQLSGIKTLTPVYYSAGMLMVIGLIPKFGAVATLIPTSVLGGAMLVMFGMVGAQGIKILSQVELNNKNLLIIAISVGLGIGVTSVSALFQQLPAGVQTLLSNGMVVGGITAVLLNALLNDTRIKEQVEE
ncbi:NCS2 family nucleobase cation symporter-2 [Lentilactobacillus senioris DSM 24302 = JCM 17472]|uniref:NCS2 family nucleobase cation symporter-2 n=1 Tax=Lentilactobacillus senioris DSM 24302 = JCM 17472 TaxID=1423802 RepID=A0A0R2CRP8_9LACO|nr:nucleobase:cation symporter-2 family protein [Lentilactobacillus senioris]KRM94463.1 NCS2 family nucleobase cation symporter-2 [Lentilactobacillus senioris DSM 24302 = JCM 17472]